MDTAAKGISIMTIVKNLGYIPAMLLGLSSESYTILAAFMLIDTITGVARAGVLGGWRSVTSFKFTSGIVSKAVVIIVPLLLVWAGRGAGLDLLPVASAALGILILAQLYSVLGNIYSIHVRRDVHEFDVVELILRQVRIIVERILVDSNKGGGITNNK